MVKYIMYINVWVDLKKDKINIYIYIIKNIFQLE